MFLILSLQKRIEDVVSYEKHWFLFEIVYNVFLKAEVH